MNKTDSQKATEEKMSEYIANGCQLDWLINPKTQTIKVYRANGSIDVLAGLNKTRSGEDVLPGFALALSVLA